MNKDLILKIAKEKDLKSFYKKYPTQAAFMKVHGKEFKKAQTASAIDKAQGGYSTPGFEQGFGMNPQSQYQNTFAPGNNLVPEFNISTPTMNTNSGFQHTNPFAMQNYGQQWGQQNPLPQQGTGQISNSVFGENKAVTGGLGGKDFKGMGDAGGAMSYMGSAMDIGKGISMIKGQREAKKQAQQNSLVTGVQASAAESRDVDIPRQQHDYITRQRNAMMRPITGEELFPVTGVGTNVLAQNGSQVRGNATEIQNTFDPYDIYDDGGYEPLNDSEQNKTYQSGGDIGQFEPMLTSASNKYINQGGEPDAGSMIGGGIGGAAGMAIGGPMGEKIGKVAGSAIGGLIDTSDRDISKFNDQSTANINRVSNQAFGKSIHSQNASYMENGGYVSNDWTPQVIAKFGDHAAEDYYDYAHEYDTLRAGGSVKSDYEPISNRGMETAALGGSVKTLWGGEVKPISHNPYMPNSGETVNFYGQSHDDGGIGVQYGEGGESQQGEQASVEVEKGEPSFEMIDPNTGKPTLNVLGDRKVHAAFAKQLGDPDLIKIADQYDGKKFKNIGLELSKKENKYTSMIDKATQELNDFKPKTQFDKFKLNSLEKNIEAAHQNLKQIADTKMTLTHYQNAINDTADELSENLGKDISSGNLNKGKVMFGKDKGQIAKYGASIDKAQVGTKTFSSEAEAIAAGYTKGADGKYHLKQKTAAGPKEETKVGEAMKEVPKGQKQKLDKTWGNVTPEQFESFKEENKDWFDFTNFNPNNKGDVSYFQRRFNEEAAKTGTPARVTVDDALGEQTITARIKSNKKIEKPTEEDLVADIEKDKVYDVKANQRNPYIDFGNQALKYFRPSDAEGLDPQELYGEMYALSNNQVEPVRAQFYHPELDVPYDISLQDSMNEITAQTRAAQKMAGYNPAAQAAIAQQAYEPINRAKGEQFRLNQAKKDQVYSGNRATLNDAQFKNLAIGDTQYTRQEAAKSNTKAINQAALSSISSKYLQNKLENRTLKTNENMYNYRFGKDFVADNYNGIFQPNMPTVYDKGDQTANMLPIYGPNGKVTGFRQVEDGVKPIEETKPAKNGKSIKSKNGSIVSAYRKL